jgi:hypothetical protein
MLMNNPFQLFLAVHIVAGTVALAIAPLAMATIKGGLWHRRWGKIYFWAMAVVAGTAGVMCWLQSGLFLFLVAIFSFYLCLTGYTVLQRKRPEQRAGLLDWLSAVIMLAAAGSLLWTGFGSDRPGDRAVRLAFGGIGVLLSGREVWGFLKPPKDPRAWFYAHMTRFLAAYIATVTAFSVVNFKFLPYFWRWMWPTMLGTVGITLWRVYYGRRFAKQRQTA